MADAIAVRGEEATRLTYSRPNAPLDAVSRRLITGEHTPDAALYHTTISAPIDYSGAYPQTLIVYILQGHGKMIVGDKELELEPGVAVLLPANTNHRHVAEEDFDLLVFWSPAPEEKLHH
jgi:hypothetical protein